MARAYRLSVKAVGDASDAQRALKQLSRSASQMHASVRRSFLNVAKAASVGIGVGLVLAVRSGVSELIEMQAANAQTAAGLKSTGGIAGVTATHITKLANAMLMKSGIDDQATQAAENQLLTFTNIRNEVGKGAKTFDLATQAAADWATKANNGAIPTAEMMSAKAIMLGKALNDPSKGYTKLAKAGVTFSDEQVRQIKNFQKHGQLAKAQGIILSEMATEFGGSAAAAGRTVAGQLGILREGFAGYAASALSKAVPATLAFAQSVGRAFSEGGKLRPILDGLSSALHSVWDGLKRAATAFSDGFAKGAGKGAASSKDMAVSLGDMAAKLGTLVGDLLPKIAALLGRLAGLMSAHKTIVKAVVIAYVAWRVATLSLSQALIGLATFAIKQVVRGMIALTASMMANPFIAVATAVTALTVGLVYLYATNEKFRTKVNEVSAALMRHRLLISAVGAAFIPVLLPIAATIAALKAFGTTAGAVANHVRNGIITMVQVVGTTMVTLAAKMLAPFIAMSGALSHLPGQAGRSFKAMHDSIVTSLDGVQKKIDGLDTLKAQRQAQNLASPFRTLLQIVTALGNEIRNLPSAPAAGGGSHQGKGRGGNTGKGHIAGRMRGRINAAGVFSGSATTDSTASVLAFARASASPTVPFLNERIANNTYTLDADVAKRIALQGQIDAQDRLVAKKVADLNAAIAAKRAADSAWRRAGKSGKAAAAQRRTAAGAKVTTERKNLAAARQTLADLTGDFEGLSADILSLAGSIAGDENDIAAQNAAAADAITASPGAAGADPAAATTDATGGTGTGDTSAADALAAREAARADAATANYNLSEAALRAFGGPGDIGYGGINGLSAAGSSTTVNINTLSGSDPRVAAALADTVSVGLNAGIYAQKTYSGSVGIGA